MKMSAFSKPIALALSVVAVGSLITAPWANAQSPSSSGGGIGFGAVPTPAPTPAPPDVESSGSGVPASLVDAVTQGNAANNGSKALSRQEVEAILNGLANDAAVNGSGEPMPAELVEQLQRLSSAGENQSIGLVIRLMEAYAGQAALIAGVGATVLPAGQVNRLADAIASRFADNLAIRRQLPGIAKALAITVNGHTRISLDSRSRIVGEAASTLIYRLGTGGADARDNLLGVVGNVLEVNPDVHFNENVLTVILQTTRAMGFPDEYMDALNSRIQSIQGGSVLLAALNQAATTEEGAGGNASPAEQGNIVYQETPVINR